VHRQFTLTPFTRNFFATFSQFFLHTQEYRPICPSRRRGVRQPQGSQGSVLPHSAPRLHFDSTRQHIFLAISRYFGTMPVCHR